MKVFAACDDFDSEKQPPACAFPCVLCAPCVLCGEGFWFRLYRAALQGLRSALRPTKRFGQRYNPKKTSASSATSAFQGFDPGLGCGSVALRFKILFFSRVPAFSLPPCPSPRETFFPRPSANRPTRDFSSADNLP